MDYNHNVSSLILVQQTILVPCYHLYDFKDKGLIESGNKMRSKDWSDKIFIGDNTIMEANS